MDNIVFEGEEPDADEANEIFCRHFKKKADLRLLLIIFFVEPIFIILNLVYIQEHQEQQ